MNRTVVHTGSCRPGAHSPAHEHPNPQVSSAADFGNRHHLYTRIGASESVPASPPLDLDTGPGNDGDARSRGDRERGGLPWRHLPSIVPTTPSGTVRPQRDRHGAAGPELGRLASGAASRPDRRAVADRPAAHRPVPEPVPRDRPPPARRLPDHDWVVRSGHRPAHCAGDPAPRAVPPARASRARLRRSALRDPGTRHARSRGRRRRGPHLRRGRRPDR